jgi:hypothetical protein
MELDREGIQRIMTGHRWSCLSPDHLRCWDKGMGWVFGGVCRRAARRFGIDPGIGWIPEASRSCDKLTFDHVDVVLATGDPFASFSLAKRLSEKWRCRYVLDYRDAWPLPSNGSLAAAVLKQEAELIESSMAVTTVSHSLLDCRLSFTKKIHVITNGFDPEEMAGVIPNEFGHPAIVYAGTFYSPKRVVTPLMAALKHLQEMEPRVPWRFHYYGANSNHVYQEAQRFGVMEKVIVHGRVARMEALSALKGAALSVVITSVLKDIEPEDRGIVTGKIFDSIGLGVPTLVIGPPGSDAEAILDMSGLGCFATADDIDGMAAFLTRVMSGNTPEGRCPEAYAWPNIIKRLDTVLRQSSIDVNRFNN